MNKHTAFKVRNILVTFAAEYLEDLHLSQVELYEWGVLGKNIDIEEIKRKTPYILGQVEKLKKIYSGIEALADHLKDTNLDHITERLNRFIAIEVQIMETTRKVLSHHAEIPETAAWLTALEDKINQLYAILRLLKRLNCKTLIETSWLAIESSRCSLMSLQAAIETKGN